MYKGQPLVQVALTLSFNIISVFILLNPSRLFVLLVVPLIVVTHF